MRVESFRAVNDRARPWVAAENALKLVVALAMIAFGNAAVLVALVTMLGLQHTMNAWASHIPHRAPRWLIAVASMLEWTRSPVVLALVYHLEHHAQPRLPCALLKPTMPVGSPLVDTGTTMRLAWAQLQLDTRPRPRPPRR
jgi:fatty acid desaturase